MVINLEKEQLNFLALKQFYPVYSDKTKRLYIDKQFRCYLFESDYEAKQFCDSIPGIHYDSSCNVQGGFISMCYGIGIKMLRVKCSSEENFRDISIRAKDVKRQFYNEDTMRNLLRLKQTCEKQYLQNISDSLFISPVILDPRKAGEYPVIHYSYAVLTQSTIHYLLFTTIQEFEKWNESQGNKYLPNQTSLQELNKVRGNNPVFINPLSDKLILTDSQIKLITKKEQA